MQSVLKSLRQTVPAFREDYATIVHGDVRHSNWIETDSGFIYLVDWDSVRLTDRMMDVAHCLVTTFQIPSGRIGWSITAISTMKLYLVNCTGLVNTLSFVRL